MAPHGLQGTAAFLPYKITIGQGPWERAVRTQDKQRIEWPTDILQWPMWLVSGGGGVHLLRHSPVRDLTKPTLAVHTLHSSCMLDRILGLTRARLLVCWSYCRFRLVLASTLQVHEAGDGVKTE